MHNPSSWGLSWLFELENTEPISSVLQVNGLSGSQSFSCNQLEFTSFLLWLQEPCLPYLCKPSQVRLGLCRQKYFQELWQIDRWLCQSRSAHGEFLSDQLCFKQGSHSTLKSIRLPCYVSRETLPRLLSRKGLLSAPYVHGSIWAHSNIFH